MAVRLTFGILGERQVDRTLAGIESNVEDWSPAFGTLRDRFLVLERHQFTSGGGYSGTWTPLSPRYAAWKARHYPGKPIMRRTDELYRSLTVGPQINIVHKDAMRLGTAVPHARFHQNPTVPGRPPRRRVVELPEGERREWAKVLQSFAVTGHLTGVRAVATP